VAGDADHESTTLAAGMASEVPAAALPRGTRHNGGIALGACRLDDGGAN